MEFARKAYLKTTYSLGHYYAERVLVSDSGLIFFPGYGWTTVSLTPYKRLVFLPKPVELRLGRSIPDSEWWRKNWQIEDWAWCYMPTKFNQYRKWGVGK